MKDGFNLILKNNGGGKYTKANKEKLFWAQSQEAEDPCEIKISRGKTSDIKDMTAEGILCRQY